ncbi:MAG: alkaline phosphatase family protein [Bryobacteraceae bacterium]
MAKKPPAKQPAKPPAKAPPKVAASLLGSIDHIVVVMLENRSFDHMLGFLYAPGNTSPLGQPFDGLTGNESNPDGKGGSVKVYRIQASDPHPYFMPGADPGEGFPNTNGQLFGTITAPAKGTPATNNGFVTNFAATLTYLAKQPNAVISGTTASQIMGMYTPDLLPVLSKLAAGYAVCDQWFSPAPTETFPNRAFASMATSQGHLEDSAANVFTAPSIFTALAKKGASWSAYGYNTLPLMRTSVADITHAAESQFGKFSDFQKAAKAGTLANYVFLEPEWSSAGNSQHPDYDVSAGEQFLHDVYYALYGTPAWAKTLLIITYDEHGGCYDHVPPPETAVTPDNSVGEYGFDFTRFGVRVPTVLVSPLIPAGTVYRSPTAVPFDHTSILATAEKRFGVAPLTKRDAAAADVGGVLTLSTPRTDDPLAGVTPPASKTSPRISSAPNHLVTALAETATSLPVPEDGGKAHQHDTPQFKTDREAVAYADKRFHDYAKSRK